MLNGDKIESVQKFKYLGVILDPTLSFTEHVEYIRNKVIPRLKMLEKTRCMVDKDTSLKLYKSLITPLFDYCSVVYDCLSARDTDRLQKIQNCALRIILKMDRRTHIKDMHEEVPELPG